MAGILNDKLKVKIDQLLTYVRRKLMDICNCDRETQTRVLADISSRVASETKLLLGNAISILSQDFITRHSNDTTCMQRYFELEIEKKLKEKYRLDYDFANGVNVCKYGKDNKMIAVGAGVVGATAGALIARLFAASFLSPHVAIVALITAAVCYLGAFAIQTKSTSTKYEEFVSGVLRDFQIKITEWLDAIEEEFNNKVETI